MDPLELMNLVSLLKDLILTDLLSTDSLFSLLSFSELHPNITRLILDLLVLLLELAYAAPTTQHTLSILLSLLECPTRAVRHLAGDIVAHISADVSIARAIAGCGAVSVLLQMLSQHRDEAVASKVLEILFSHNEVAESDSATSAVASLARYLMDPTTCSRQGRLASCLALGNLFQSERQARSRQAGMGVSALVQILQTAPSADETVVSLCALQNLVVNKNTGAVLQNGGGQVALDMLAFVNADVASQAAILVRLLVEDGSFGRADVEHVFSAAADALEERGGGEELLKTVQSLLATSPHLTLTSSATSAIPLLVQSLGTESKQAQEAALDCVGLFMRGWASGLCGPGIIKAQSLSASSAIPALQRIMKEGPDDLKGKSGVLLRRLPGVLTVVVGGARNCHQVFAGRARVHCQVAVDGCTPKRTRVSVGPSPQWAEEMEWALSSPPREIQISCKNNNMIAKRLLGRALVRADHAVRVGSVAGEVTLLPESNSGRNRMIKMEVKWGPIT